MKNKMLSTAFAIGIACCVNAQQTPAAKKYLPFKYTVEAAPDWTNLFKRTHGWFGADGIFSIPLSGIDKNNNEGNDSTLLLFSDTYIGDVKDGKPMQGCTMVNNTIAYIKGNDPDPKNIQFKFKLDADKKPATFFVPQSTTTAKPQLFWLGDGFVNKELHNNLYIFGYKVERTGAGAFDFIEPEVAIIAIPKGSQPPFKEQRQIQTALHINNTSIGEGNFGSGVLVNTKWAGAPAPDGYVYVYGCIGKDKNLVAARVKPANFEKLEKWNYWNGQSWTTNKEELKPITNGVSDELSMTPLPDGRFLLIFQEWGLSDKVGMRIAESPVGPFGELQHIWTAPESKEGLWTYNAKAHLNLSKPGELLISYNTITDDFFNAIQKNADIYHPRFFKLKFEIK